MPTIALQVGQCGNQLGDTLWHLLFQQHTQQATAAASSGSWLGREFFSSTASHSSSDAVFTPRVICVDSEAKVCRQGSDNHRLHVLGHGGCGNNWACGYSFGRGRCQSSTRSAWSSSDDAVSRVEQVLEGVRRECELAAGVPDFLLLASLAGGTGSGTGSALLEALADEYPASTLGAVAVAPGRTGDSTVQSINTCLALQHLQSYAHAVILIDNQVILDQLNNSASSHPSSKQAAAAAAAAGGKASAAAAAAPGRACLTGVNRVAAEALTGLLSPLSNEDLLAGRSTLRHLASTVCADPLTKFVELCSLAQPESSWTSSSSCSSTANPWPARVKLLSAQLPRYDAFSADGTPVTTSAAQLITRGMPGTSTAGVAVSRLQPLSAAAMVPSRLASAWPPAPAAGLRAEAGAAGSGASFASQGSWQQQLAAAVCCSWPYFAGSQAEVHLGSSTVAVWNTTASTAGATSKTGGSAQQPSITAAVRRSSIGSLMQAAAQRTLQLCDAGAFTHWYESYGCAKADIERAAFAVADAGAAYLFSS